MVRRSLVLKIYLYALLGLVLTMPVAFWAGRTLMDEGRREGFHRFLAPQLTFMAAEVERAWTPQGVPQARLDQLGQALHHRIRFVPWSSAGTYPAALRQTKLIIDPLPPDRHPRHWVRIERDGQPVGAVAISPLGGPPGRPRPPLLPFPPPVAGVWVLLLLLILVPPLWLWVIRPLRSMVAVARRLGGGDLQTPIPLRRQDEFGELERAFEGMRLALRDTIAHKERLLTDVSHEVRGPLARMTLALPLLHQEGATGPITAIFERELRAADDLLSDVLALARGRHPVLVKEKADLAAVVRALIDERLITIKHRQQQIHPALAPAPVLGDQRLLARALGNVIDNALKYTQSGGRIRIVTGNEGAQTVVCIEDDGPGIAAEHLPHIFDPFYRPDDSRSRETGGTGLGLAIVKAITESHGGTVTLESTEGQGTRVELRFPPDPGL